MRRAFYLVLFVLFLVTPSFAQRVYHIEVLQVGNTDTYTNAYEGLVDGLARQGLVKGYNLTIGRTVLDRGQDPSFWDRITFDMKMSAAVTEVVAGKPDLVVTLGTQATEAFRDTIREAGIPQVFSAACPSQENPGKETTGVVIRPQPSDLIKTTLLALPDIDRIGVIRTGNPEAQAFTADLTREGKKHGITVIEKEVGSLGSPGSLVKDMLVQGVDAFIIPTDSAYEADNWKASRELIAETTLNRVPCISALLNTSKGSLITLAPDFGTIGNTAAKQISEILTQGKKPSELAVVTYTEQNFVVDLNTSRRLGISFRSRSNSLFGMK